MQEQATAISPRLINSDDAPQAIGPYSQAIRVPYMRALLFVSGQLPISSRSEDEEGVLDLQSQYRLALENALAIVRAGGGGPHDVVKATVFLTDLTRYDEFNAVYSEFFDDWRPARSVVQVSGLPRGAPVEVELIAAVLEPSQSGHSEHAEGAGQRSDLGSRFGKGRRESAL